MEFVSQSTCEVFSENTVKESDGMIEILRNLKSKYTNDINQCENETAKLIEKAIIDLTNVTLTENGDRAYSSTMNVLVDLYYKSIRDVDENDVRELFERCWNENTYLTMRLIAHIRDIREGKGERQIGRILLDCVAKKSIEEVRKNAHVMFHTYGRWDDGIFVEDVKTVESQVVSKGGKKCVTTKEDKIIYSKELKDVYVETVVKQLHEDMNALHEGKTVSLCAKWIPSEKSKHGDVYKSIVKAYASKYVHINKRMNYGDFRRTVLVPLRRKIDILETKLCNMDYTSIDYEKVPSVAMNKHSKAPSKKAPKSHRISNAFMRNDAERFKEYKAKLSKGTAKVNVAALFPHQIVTNYCDENHNTFKHISNDDLIEAQWKAMVEKTASMGRLNETLVLADVSGSMRGLPMIISYTMGILVSSIAKCEVWKDVVLTFESRPQLVKVQGNTLYEKLRSISRTPWGGTTDFMAAMRVILDMAKSLKLNQDDLPKKILVVSDMQFNQADDNAQSSSFEVIEKEFCDAGYVLPQMVFWNVRSTSTVPVMSGIKGVSLVSGYSPNVLRSVMEDKTITPEETMMNAIMDSRYDLIQ
jgi:hypothetical protein